MQEKKIFLAADHGGAVLKNALVQYLKAQGYTLQDFGPKDETVSVDYPDKALKLIQTMKKSPTSRGILVCTTGIGMSIAVNRYSFLRGALVLNPDMAKMCRSHNDANVLVFGAKYMPVETAKECVDIFLNTAFEGGRHARRVNKLSAMGERK